MNLAAIDLSADAAPVGFHLALGFGTSAEVVHEGEATDAEVPGRDLWRHVLNASVSYLAPLGSGLLLEGGVYTSHIGLEELASKDNWTYTRSWMGELSPYYQAGVKAAYKLSDHLSAQLHLLNGWQAISRPGVRLGESLGTQLEYKTERVDVLLNTFEGPFFGAADGQRWFVDAVAEVQATPVLGLALTADAGVLRAPDGSWLFWRAAALLARIGLGARSDIAFRLEAFDDPAGAASGTPQTLTEGTFTLDVRPAPALILKAEARYDRSTARVFGGASDPTRSIPSTRADQVLGILGAVATF